MRSRIVLLIWSGIVLAQAPADKPASIEGTIVNSATGEPIRKAEISMANGNMTEEMAAMMKQLPDMPKIPGQTLATQTVTATSDGNGKFRFDKVTAGTYWVTVKKVGFGDGSKESLTLTAGQALSKLDFKLVPNGTISGRVVDEDGDPYPNAMVTAQKYVYMGGHKRLMPLDTAQVNGKGEFSLSKVPPGTYYVCADTQNFQLEASASETAYVRTCFPSATDEAMAQKTEIAPGAEVNGISILMRKGKVVTIKGKLVDVSGAPITNAQVMLMGGTRMGTMAMKMVNNPEGKFEIGNLQPGAYTAMVMQMQGGSPKMSMIPLVVGDKNIDDLRLGPKPDGAIQGSVMVEGDAKIALNAFPILLTGDETVAIMPSRATPDATGKFTLEHVTPAIYDLDFNHVPEGAYVKSATFNGREVLGQPIDCSSAAAGRLAIVLGTDGGKLMVTVRDGDKAAVGAKAVLLPADPARRFPVHVQDETSDEAGQVTFKDVPPGEYLVLAWPKVEEDAWLDPDFVKKYEDHGVKVRVASKGSDKIELKLAK